MATAVICGILIIICIFGVRSSVNRIAHGCCGSGTDTVKKIKAEDRDISHYPYLCIVKIKGMTCNNCRNRVENAFHEQEGFYATVSLKEKQADIYMKKTASEAEIQQIVRQSGYEPERVTFVKNDRK